MPAAVSEKPASLTFYPFAYALYNENLPQHCWYCLDEERTHYKCTACGTAVFCNKECQTLGWKDHMYECKALRKTKAIPNIEVRLLGRIVTRHKAILAGKDKNDPNFYKDRSSRRNIMDIWAHTKDMRNDPYAMSNFNSIYDELAKFYDAKALLSKDTVFELHCRDFINRHAISDSGYLKEIGKGLYLDLCAYDHSCRPNTVYVCKGFVATLRPLNASVNLLDRSTTFYSYVDLFCGKQARKKLLKDTWYFNCECDRCQDNSEHILTSMLCPNCEPNKRNRLCLFGEHGYKDAKTQLITCPVCETQLSEESVMEALGAMRFIDDVLDKREVEQMSPSNARSFVRDLLERFENLLPKANVYYCKLIQATRTLLRHKALIQYTEPSDFTSLLKLHKDAEECLRICYPQNHPALAFHCRNIGIFSRKVGSLTESIDYLREAKSIFDYVLQPNHPLAKSTSDFLAEAENELNRLKNAADAAQAKRKSREGEAGAPVTKEEETADTKSDESDVSQRSNGSSGAKRKAQKTARSPTPLPELIQSDSDSAPTTPKATDIVKAPLIDEHIESIDAEKEAKAQNDSTFLTTGETTTTETAANEKPLELDAKRSAKANRKAKGKAKGSTTPEATSQKITTAAVDDKAPATEEVDKKKKGADLDVQQPAATEKKGEVQPEVPERQKKDSKTTAAKAKAEGGTVPEQVIQKDAPVVKDDASTKKDVDKSKVDNTDVQRPAETNEKSEVKPKLTAPEQNEAKESPADAQTKVVSPVPSQTSKPAPQQASSQNKKKNRRKR